MPEQSLIPTEVQVELWDESQLPAGRELLSIDEDEKRGKFTGERVAKNRARYAAIVRTLAEGCGIRATARAHGVSTHTVQAIRDREGLGIATAKLELAALWGHFARISVERLIEEHDQIPINQLTVPAAVGTDKEQFLRGEATTIIEHRTQRDNSAEIRAHYEELKSALVVPAVVPAVGPDRQLTAPQEPTEETK